MSAELDQADAQQSRVGLSNFRIFSYCSLYMPVSMVLLPVMVYVLPFYAELGISMYLMSAIIFAARLSDAFTDPLIGVLSDRTKGRFGRRKPWILCGAPLLMVSMYMLFVPPENPSAWYFGTWIVLLYLAFTIVDLPYFAWGAELSTDYDERTLITSRREQFHFAGTITFNLLPLAAALLIYLAASSDESLSGLWNNFGSEFQAIMASRAGHIDVILEWLANFVLVAIPVTVVIALVFVREPEQKVIARRKPKFIDSLRVVRRNGPFIRVIVCYTVSTLGAAVTASLSYFFVKHVIQVGELYPIYLLVYYASSVAGLPLWTMLSKRVGKHRAYIYALFWFAFWACWIPFIPAGMFGLFLVVMCFKGSAVGALLALPASMAADAVDIDSARTGEQRAGLYFSIWGMLKKGSYAAGSAIGLAAVAFLGFDPMLDPSTGGTADGNSADALLWLAILYSIVPAMIKFVAVPFIWSYPLTEVRQRRIRERIERRGVVAQTSA
ncbi:MAG: GPH family glycoside/pentoside/hexuronide:cation symporter [Limisphaerales bacterium]|jgi:GPH family glycoside/pentoside/hexuronide:cation symporter